MVRKTVLPFLALGLAAVLLVRHAVPAFASDDGRGGWGYGETYPCQTCSETSMSDLNQYVLKDTDPGEHVSQTYWNPLPGEEGRYLWMCGYRGGATGGDLAYAIRVYYEKEGANYRSHLDGWEIPGDGGRGFPLTFGNGWKVKAKWYEDSVTNDRPCSEVDLTTNTCYYSNGTSEQCDALSVGSDGYYHCVTTIKGWVFGDETQIVSGKQAEALCRDVNPHIGWVQTTDEYDLPPCQTITVVQEEDGSVTIGCTMHYYNASVSVSFCAAVDRKPYPRAMTGKPVFFKIDPAQEYESASPPIDFCTPDIQQYQLTLIARPDGRGVPIWKFNDRPWAPDQTAKGWEVQHTFQTSSWGLGHMGPSLTGEWLPAYQVEGVAPFRIYVRRTWRDFHGNFHDTGEQPLNLLDFGYPTEDLWVPVYDATTPPPGAPEMRWPQCIIPVPVVESQGVITGP